MISRLRALATPSPVPNSVQAGRSSRSAWAGSVVNAAVLAVMLFTAAHRHTEIAVPSVLLTALTLAAWLPLLARNRWPLAALVATVAVEATHLVVLPVADTGHTMVVAVAAYQPVPLATMVAAWTVASRLRWPIGWVPGGIAALLLLVVSLISEPISLLATDLVMVNLVVLSTAAGAVLMARRERAVRLVREHAEQTRQQVVGERLRIARDLHDVLAHHLTLVNAQAGVAEYLLHADPDAASTALRDIASNTRHALDELRSTVGLLRQDVDGGGDTREAADGLQPVPGLHTLAELLDRLRLTGADIECTVVGTPRSLAPSVDLAAYRIIQEALTNATKHAPGAQVRVALVWSGRGLELRVANGPGRGDHVVHRAAGTGHGLIGMRERAANCGGTARAERTSGGGFLVVAALPVTSGATGVEHAETEGRQG